MPAAEPLGEMTAVIKSRDIQRLRADVAVNCRLFVALCKAEGLPVLVTETVRDLEYQAALYAKGRTEPGAIVTNQKKPSFHWDKVGLAFDIAKNVKGHEEKDGLYLGRRLEDAAGQAAFSVGRPRKIQRGYGAERETAA